MNDLRRSKLESLILQMLSGMIRELKDHRIGSDLAISAVKASKDGAYIDVYVSSFANAQRSSEGAKGLNSAAGFIRRALAPKLHLRKIPSFRFHPDHSFRVQMAVQEQLEKLVPPKNGESQAEISKISEISESSPIPNSTQPESASDSKGR